MIKTSLVINSKNPKAVWLEQCIESAQAFDEIVLYIDGEKYSSLSNRSKVVFVGDGKERNIGQGLNYAIAQATGNWICPFCDDDYFHKDALDKLIHNLKLGLYNTHDIVHGTVSLDNGGTWGSSKVSLEAILASNLVPFGSFYKREVFERLKGYSETVGAYNDWNFWIRAAKENFKFKFFDMPLYHFRQGHESATVRLLKEIGGHGEAVNEVLKNA